MGLGENELKLIVDPFESKKDVKGREFSRIALICIDTAFFIQSD